MKDWRLDNVRWAKEAGWVRAKRALHAAFASSTPAGTEIDVGFVRALGRGLTRSAFGTSVDLSPDPEGRSGAHVALIPQDDDPNYAVAIEREAAALQWLAEQEFELRTPRVVGLVDDRGTPILVESFVEGISLDLRAGRQPIRPWKVIAEAAVKIHSLPPPPSLKLRNCREHRQSTIEALERWPVRHGIVEDALAWMRSHLGEARPGVLLHGDLLGHNLRLHPSEGLGVIDWHHVEIGDPGADLAVITRGIRRPFQIPDGRQKLLDAYARASATGEVSADALRFFELAMLSRWVVETQRNEELDHAWLNQIARLLAPRSP